MVIVVVVVEPQVVRVVSTSLANSTYFSSITLSLEFLLSHSTSSSFLRLLVRSFVRLPFADFAGFGREVNSIGCARSLSLNLLFVRHRRHRQLTHTHTECAQNKCMRVCEYVKRALILSLCERQKQQQQKERVRERERLLWRALE